MTEEYHLLSYWKKKPVGGISLETKPIVINPPSKKVFESRESFLSLRTDPPNVLTGPRPTPGDFKDKFYPRFNSLRAFKRGARLDGESGMMVEFEEQPGSLPTEYHDSSEVVPILQDQIYSDFLHAGTDMEGMLTASDSHDKLRFGEHTLIFPCYSMALDIFLQQFPPKRAQEIRDNLRAGIYVGGILKNRTPAYFKENLILKYEKRGNSSGTMCIHLRYNTFIIPYVRYSVSSEPHKNLIIL